MNAVQLGPFVLPFTLLLWAGTALGGFGVQWIRTRGHDDAANIRQLLWNALLVWFAGWKLSQLIFDASVFRGSWAALLYFHGGIRGALLAAAGAALYVWLAGKKHAVAIERLADSLLIALLGGYTSYILLLAIWGEGNRMTLTLLVVLGAVMLALWLYRGRTPVNGKAGIQLVLTFVIGHMLVSAAAGQLWERSMSGAAGADVGLRVGQRAPDFTLTDTAGNPVQLSKLQGQTVVLNFWATWCPPCRVEMPALQQFHDSRKESGVIVIGVNATNTEAGAGEVGRWLEQNGYTFPVVYDPNGDVVRLYRVYAYPSTYIIGPDGVVREKHQGPMNEVMLGDAVR
ncbi:peroxiredoxin family protein [Paenibacillus chartarius]|uniref:Peroxiredoxin family protein n=1 Tax=Paenibacillus chartarius TaxID=747481 RepID=A0ABV6DHV9_9BACL